MTQRPIDIPELIKFARYNNAIYELNELVTRLVLPDQPVNPRDELVSRQAPISCLAWDHFNEAKYRRISREYYSHGTMPGPAKVRMHALEDSNLPYGYVLDGHHRIAFAAQNRKSHWYHAEYNFPHIKCLPISHWVLVVEAVGGETWLCHRREDNGYAGVIQMEKRNGRRYMQLIEFINNAMAGPGYIEEVTFCGSNRETLSKSRRSSLVL